MSIKNINKALRDAVQKIATDFQPERIILFGSRAWGKPGPNSDSDLLVVKKTRRSTRTLAREIDGALWGRQIPLDILVYTPERIQQRIRRGDLFIKKIVREGKILYARKKRTT